MIPYLELLMASRHEVYATDEENNQQLHALLSVCLSHFHGAEQVIFVIESLEEHREAFDKSVLS